MSTLDPRSTPCIEEMGVVADTFWRQPGVLQRQPAFLAAAGPQAARITAPHPVEIPHGIDSPVGRVYELDGQVLLLGIGHPSDTTIHLAELLAGCATAAPSPSSFARASRSPASTTARTTTAARTLLVAGWLDAKGLQRRGVVGHAGARLVRSRDIVETVVERLRAEETIFLHPYGVDEECDEARASIPF